MLISPPSSHGIRGKTWAIVCFKAIIVEYGISVYWTSREKPSPGKGRAGNFFPSMLGRPAVFKISCLPLSLKYSRCNVHGVSFPWASTMEEASDEVSLMRIYIILLIKHQRLEISDWVRQLRNVLVKLQQVWLMEKDLGRVKRGFLCSLFFQGQ